MSDEEKQKLSDDFGEEQPLLNNDSKEKGTDEFWIGDPSKEYKPAEIISHLGFGKFQITACFVVGLAFISGFSSIQLQPFLSVRLYVELQLTEQQQSLMSFFSLLGLVVASFPFGFLCDKIGRKKALMLACFLMLLFNLLTCVWTNFVWITFMRFFVSLSRGTIAAGLLYCVELIPERHVYLGPLIGNQIAGATIGDCLAIFVGAFLLSDDTMPWQYYVIAMSAPMFLFLIVAPCLLEETPQYYLVKGDDEKAKKIFQKIARQNGASLPENVKIVLNNKDEVKADRDHFWGVVKNLLTCSAFMHPWVCVIFIGAMGRLMNDGLNFVLADLLYLDGESGNYCNGANTQTYYLSKEDYWTMLLAQMTTFSTVFISYALIRAGVSIKYQSLSCFLFSIPLVASLYLCPDPIIAFVLLSLVRIACQVSNLAALQALVKFMIPTEVRGSILGLGNSLRTIPLPFYPLVTQTLSKKSQHFVTTVTIILMVIGLIAAILLPRDINERLRHEQDNLRRVKKEYEAK